MDTCQLSFVTCEPVWSNNRFNIQCKRGYFPYGCFHVVKGFVKETTKEPSSDIGRAIEDNESNRLLKFKSYLRQKPLNKVQRTVENIFDTEKNTRFEPSSLRPSIDTENINKQEHIILTPWNHWFQRVFCMPVMQFNHFNNFPQHYQWRSDCRRFQPGFGQPFIQPETRGMFEQKGNTDSKIYFPDAAILSKNQNQ